MTGLGGAFSTSQKFIAGRYSQPLSPLLKALVIQGGLPLFFIHEMRKSLRFVHPIDAGERWRDARDMKVSRAAFILAASACLPVACATRPVAPASSVGVVDRHDRWSPGAPSGGVAYDRAAPLEGYRDSSTLSSSPSPSSKSAWPLPRIPVSSGQSLPRTSDMLPPDRGPLGGEHPVVGVVPSGPAWP